jgi:hypothetical protein
MKNNNLGKVGAGILSSLEEMEDINSAGVKEQKSNGVKEDKSNTPKTKRSFMLTDKQIEMIYILKSKSPKKDLSEIVGEAIEKAYEETE